MRGALTRNKISRKIKMVGVGYLRDIISYIKNKKSMTSHKLILILQTGKEKRARKTCEHARQEKLLNRENQLVRLI